MRAENRDRYAFQEISGCFGAHRRARRILIAALNSPERPRYDIRANGSECLARGLKLNRMCVRWPTQSAARKRIESREWRVCFERIEA